jgi:hypothetical protein
MSQMAQMAQMGQMGQMGQFPGMSTFFAAPFAPPGWGGAGGMDGAQAGRGPVGGGFGGDAQGDIQWGYPGAAGAGGVPGYNLMPLAMLQQQLAQQAQMAAQQPAPQPHMRGPPFRRGPDAAAPGAFPGGAPARAQGGAFVPPRQQRLLQQMQLAQAAAQPQPGPPGPVRRFGGRPDEGGDGARASRQPYVPRYRQPGEHAGLPPPPAEE